MSLHVWNFLVLGSGLMTDSVVSILLRNPQNMIHIASNILEDAKHMATKKGLHRCTYSEVDVANAASLKPLVFACDIVISYIPAFLHHHVARVCLDLGKHMVTASYITKELMEFDQEAKQKGLIFLCELGLDPGIDHIATMKIMDQVEEIGGKVVEYESWCGGLPAPSSFDNPLGYKFTWSPIGAFRALKNKAVFINGGQQVEIEPSELLYSWNNIEINSALVLQGYPNRDSLSYKDIYGLKDARRVLRGTLRYRGFCQMISAFKELGYFDETKVMGDSWLDYTTTLLGMEKGETIEEKVINRTVNNIKHYADYSTADKKKEGKKIIHGLNYFGCLEPIKFADPKGTNLDNLVELLKPKLSLRHGDMDLIAMQHRFIIEYDGRRFLRKSSLITIGEPNGFTAMSITVATPTAIGAELVLEGKISERGVIRPVYKDIYQPCLERLEKAGIRLVEEEEELD